MWDTFGQDPRRSIFERFHLFMNCCNVFFHVILDWKLNVSKLAESLAARIVWCCAYVGHFWPRSVTFNFWVSFSDTDTIYAQFSTCMLSNERVAQKQFFLAKSARLGSKNCHQKYILTIEQAQSIFEKYCLLLTTLLV